MSVPPHQSSFELGQRREWDRESRTRLSPHVESQRPLVSERDRDNPRPSYDVPRQLINLFGHPSDRVEQARSPACFATTIPRWFDATHAVHKRGISLEWIGSSRVCCLWLSLWRETKWRRKLRRRGTVLKDLRFRPFGRGDSMAAYSLVLIIRQLFWHRRSNKCRLGSRNSNEKFLFYGPLSIHLKFRYQRDPCIEKRFSVNTDSRTGIDTAISRSAPSFRDQERCDCPNWSFGISESVWLAARQCSCTR